MKYDIYINKTSNVNYLNIYTNKDIFKFLYDYFTVKNKNAYYHPAYRKKLWDGKIHFLYQNGQIYSGLLLEILKIAKINNWSVNYDKNLFLNNYNFTIEDIKTCLKDVNLYPEQISVIYKLLKFNYGLCKLPTASGKSYIEIALMNLYKKKGINDMILIVPRQTLVEQIYEDLITKSNYIKKDEVGRCYTGLKDLDKQIIITTWQSLKNLLELDKNYANRFKLLIQDEVHVNSSEAKIVKKVILSFFAKFKYGFSATILDRDTNRLEYFNLVSIFGPILVKKDIKELQNKNRISKEEIHIRLLKYKNPPEISNYFEYEEFIRNSIERIEYLKSLIAKVREKINNGNILILIRNINTAENVKKILEKIYDDVYLIVGSVDVKDRIFIKDEINNNKNKILIATEGCFQIGENIPNLHCLILYQLRKSEIAQIQSIGRVLRKTSDKKVAVIIDICDDLIVVKNINGKQYKKNYGKKHLKIRINTYKKYNFNINSIKEVYL